MSSVAAAPDTIVAAATPPGRGGVAIVRISGSMVPAMAEALLGALPAPRHATFARWHDAEGGLIDMGLALYFPAPHSFTGEPVLELHGHGGAVVVDALIERVVQLGARRARAGEFTERAFHNDKIDLAQAEAIADLIEAGSRRAAQAALRSLQGEFSARVNATRAALVSLRVYVEAAIDFPEEEIDFLGSQELRERLQDVQQRLAGVLKAAEEGAVLARGLTVAIAGRPNAGKSTLMNALAGDEVAIVTPVAGTTRDLLRARLEIEGVAVELIDTAGLRELSAGANEGASAGARAGSGASDKQALAAPQDHDTIEAEGMRRAREAMARADHLLFLVDAGEDPGAQAFAAERATLPADVPVTVVMNKVDLLPHGREPMTAMAATPAMLQISAATGRGLDALRRHIAALAGQGGEDAGAFSARTRHVEALRRAMGHLDAATAQLGGKQAELAALELREAQRELGEVVGDVSSDELLGEIFGSFCIGK